MNSREKSIGEKLKEQLMEIRRKQSKKNKKKVTSIDDLPNEILCKIFKNLPRKNRKLAAQVCTLFRDVAKISFPKINYTAPSISVQNIVLENKIINHISPVPEDPSLYLIATTGSYYTDVGMKVFSLKHYHSIELFNINSQKTTMILADHPGEVQTLIALSDKRFVTKMRNQNGITHSLLGWNWQAAETNNYIHLLVNSTNGGAISCVVSKDNNHVIVATGNYGYTTLNLWNVQNGLSEKAITVSMSGNEFITCMLPLSNNQIIIGSSSGVVRILDLSTGNDLYTIPKNESPVIKIAFLPGSKEEKLIIGFSCGTLQFWDIPTKTCTKTLSTFHDIYDFQCLPEGDIALIGNFQFFSILSKENDTIPISVPLMPKEEMHNYSHIIPLSNSEDGEMAFLGNGKITIRHFPRVSEELNNLRELKHSPCPK